MSQAPPRAYVISEVEIVDEQLGDRYRQLAAASIAAHGGCYLVRGAEPTAAEGEWRAGRRLVIVEFPDREAVERWYASPEYAGARVLSATALERRLLFADGTGAPDA